MVERYRYSEDVSWGNRRHVQHGGAGAVLLTYKDTSVSTTAPELVPYLDTWITHEWAGRTEQIRVRDHITFINGKPWVKVERKFPWTGGIVPVANVLDSLRKAKPCVALGFPICTAIVVYKEKAAG